MDPRSPINPRPRVFYGWYIVGICTALTSTLASVNFSYGIFFSAMRTAFGWSSASIAGAFALQEAERSVAQPLSGFLVDRFGSRVMILVGTGLAGLGLVLLSRISELWHFYAVFLVISLGLSFGFGIPLNAVLVNWFRRRRSRALSIMWSGSALGGVLVFVVGILVTSVGWRDAVLVMGVAVWVMGISTAAVVRNRPEPYGHSPDGWSGREMETDRSAGATISPTGLTLRDALGTRAFWILALSTGLHMGVISSLGVHQVVHMEQAGLSLKAAAAVVAAGAIALLLGRLPYAFVGDRIPKSLLLVGLLWLLSAATGVFVYADHYWALGLYVGARAISQGVIVPFAPAAIADYMGTRAFGSITGLFQLPGIIGGVLGPLFLGAIFDWRGEYDIGLLAMAGVLALVAPLGLFLKRPDHGTA